MSNTKILNTIPVGETFRIGEFEFIKFADENGVTVAVSKEILYHSAFGDNNDFSKSDILKKLTDETLPKIEAVIEAENVVEFETDLLSLDGSAKHGTVKSKISIPTFDFYRRNRAIFEKYKLDNWWWLATPDSTSEYYNDRWCVCVSPSGYIGSNFNYRSDIGVRPFLNFVSSISVSCDC
jgi:hypothetical protein